MYFSHFQKVLNNLNHSPSVRHKVTFPWISNKLDTETKTQLHLDFS